ncbi:MAG: SdiA-regulated domain-containing protein [Planctomycetes bacterium]|nr:SdiA-regulated domain-containing protein [Planctomycetota bacterium]
MLSAFDLASYELHFFDPNLPDVGDQDYSGVAYNFDTNRVYIVDNQDSNNSEETNIYEYDLSGTLIRTIDLGTKDFPNRFDDTEGIVYMGKDGNDFMFAVIEEGLGIINEITIPPGTTDITINKTDAGTSSTTISPNPAGGFGDNKGLEGIAWDSVADIFYVVDEKTPNFGVYLVQRNGSTADPLSPLDITNLAAGEPGVSDPVTDLADVFFANDYLSLLSEESEVILKVRLSDNTIVEQYPAELGQTIEDRLPLTDPEGLAFSPDGFDMFVVGERRQLYHYRNYTGFTPNAAPDLDNDTNNITNDTTPTFSGTLTRTVGGNTVPVDAASVWLYVDGTKTGVAAETDVNGNYSVTAAALGDGTYDFTIKVSEKNDFSTAIFSIVSSAVSVQFFYSDLTDNGYVDFQDLTVLLANWNKDVSAAQGNLVDPDTTLINFADLTVLLAEWTGPDPGGPSPPASMVAHSSTVPISGDPTVYSSSASVTVSFTEKVLGVDATDMVLSGSGTSGASVGTPSALRVNDGVWTFIISGLSIGTVDVTVASDVNDITYDDGGASVDTIEWAFIAMPGVTFTSGVLVIEGTSGDDTITVAVAGGDLTLNGAKVNLGSGDIAASAVTSILIQGYAGDDTIDLSAVTSSDFTGAGLNGNITIYGGSGSDMLTGSSFDDVIDGDQGTYIARWELNEIDGSGYTPDWVGGYDGEIIDDPQVTAGGPSGDGYLAFDGGDDLTIDRVHVGDGSSKLREVRSVSVAIAA